MTKEQQLHWRMRDPSHTPTMLHESHIGQGTNREKQGENLHCPAKLPAQSGQKESRCAATAPTEGRVWSPHKLHFKTGARQHKDVRVSVSSCSLPLCGRSTKTFPHSWMTCLQTDSLSHWTLHDIVSHCARSSAQRQLMPCFTSAAFANDR